MGLVDKIRSAAAKSGANKGKLFYIRDGGKARIRFLQELDSGFEVVFHDNYERGINCMCQEQLGKNCKLCGDEGLRTRELYCFSVWDYEAKEVKLFLYAANNFTPLPAIAAMSENYGTITDRDYVIECRGKQQSKTFSVIPQDKVKFRNDKAKPYTKSAAFKIIDKAFPMSDSDADIDYDGNNYDEMSAKELYVLCKERDIDVESRKDKDYYIDRLKDSQDDEDWSEVEDEVESNEKYDGLSAKELYMMCKERGLQPEQKKSEKFYIDLLKEADKAEEEWGDDEDAETSDDDGDWGEDDEASDDDDGDWGD